MKKFFTAVLLAFAALQLNAQWITDKVFVVSGGLFEFSPPYTDFTSVHVYEPYTGQLTAIDEIKSQSTQGALCDGNAVYVFTPDSIVMYNATTNFRSVAIMYPGISPRPGTFAVNDSLLAVSNWYGHDDSGVYLFDKHSLLLKEVIAQADKEVTALAFIGNNLLMGQNIKGTVDLCPPFGCFADSIGQYASYNLLTHTYLGPFTQTENEGGINSFFVKGDSVIHPNSNAATISVMQNGLTTTHAVTGDVGRGVYLNGNDFYFMLNGRLAVFNLVSNTVTSSNLSAIGYPAAFAYDELTGLNYETATDYASFGKTYISLSQQLIDSFDVGISPEGIALHRIMNEDPVAFDDTITIHYSNDTVVAVAANDVDSTMTPLSVSIIEQPLVPGSAAFIVNGNEILYIPAAGIVTSDSLRYLACDQANRCDTAVLVVHTYGNTAINEEQAARVVLAPNPNQGRSYIYSDAPIHNIKAAALNGEIIQNHKADGQKQALLDLPAGIYVVTIQTDKGQVIRKVVSLN